MASQSAAPWRSADGMAPVQHYFQDSNVSRNDMKENVLTLSRLATVAGTVFMKLTGFQVSEVNASNKFRCEKKV